MNSLEFTILNNLVTNDQFRRQTFPYLKKEYFEEEHNKLLFDLISNFIHKYEKCPTKESLAIDLQNVGSLTDQQFKISLEAIDKVSDDEITGGVGILIRKKNKSKKKKKKNTKRRKTQKHK